jgi:hypothetical protein
LRANHVEESVPSSSNSLVVAADGSKKDVEKLMMAERAVST